MKYTKFLSIAIGVGFALPVIAQETTDLRLNVRKIGLDLMATHVGNAEEYTNNPNSELSTDNSTMIKGVFDVVLEYEMPNGQWNNSLFMQYGRTEIKPVGEKASVNESTDQILLTTDYNQKLYKWDFAQADVGPFINLGYETEFVANEDSPRYNAIRTKLGFKAFNGVRVEDLYIAAVGEYDFTYTDDTNIKSAVEIGGRYKYPYSEEVVFGLEGYYRDYLSYSQYVSTDLTYEVSIKAKMDVKVMKKFAISPYISYFQGKARGADKTGSNFMTGLSFSYADLFNL